MVNDVAIAITDNLGCGDNFHAIYVAMSCSTTTMCVHTYINLIIPCVTLTWDMSFYTYLCIFPLKASVTMVADLKMKP